MNEKKTGTMRTIRVLVVDDHTIIRKGIRAVLDLVPDIDLVGEAENGLQAVKLEQELAPDVILMDLMMPEMDGIAAIKEIKKQRPTARILVLTNLASPIIGIAVSISLIILLSCSGDEGSGHALSVCA